MRKGQSLVEYFILMSVFLTAVLATGFIQHMTDAFRTYFDNAVTYLR